MDFFEMHRERLAAFYALSQSVGARADYAQGGGGNTSVKLKNGLMAIKASGYRLSDVRPDAGYAVLDGKAVREFYLAHEPESFADVEKECAAFTKTQIREAGGLPALRPSVEAGFHSLLGGYVLHSHSVYTNLAACAEECERVLERAFGDAGFSWGATPYADPGARLTFAIRDELARVERRTGKIPAVLVLRNHGLIVHGDDPDECLAIHAEANERVAALFGLSGASFPEVRIRKTGEDAFVSDTPYLCARLRGGAYSDETLLTLPLYPDQMVFLTGVLGETAVVERESGVVNYRMAERAALAIEQTLAAVVFVSENVGAAGLTLRAMGEAARAFIANWESETYRRQLAGGGKA